MTLLVDDRLEGDGATMTDQGGWGGWSPERRPDEREPRDAAEQTTPAPAPEPGGGTTEPPHTYGAPQYGEPQYGEPQIGEPQNGEPQYGAPSYGAPSYGAPTYGGGAPAPSPQPTSPQPTSPQPTYQQPTYQQPTSQLPTSPSYEQPQGGGYAPPSAPPSYGGYAPPAQNPPVENQPTQAFGGYGYQGGPPQQGPPAPPYGGYGTAGTPPPPPPKKKRSGARLALILGLVVLLVAGLGVGAWALFLRGGPAVTWQGKEVANPDQLLTEAQNDLNALVSDAKGAKGDDTRCYYAVPKNPPKDTPKTDVGDTVYCGPALFVDGDTGKPFIPYGIAAGSTDGDKVTLSVTAKGTQDGATSVPADQDLVRPDGASAPNGTGGLKVPEPPPAEENVFTSVDDLDVPDAPAGATMGALTGGVSIVKLGEVPRYGSGSDARSAPDGQKLIAFQLDDAPGDGASDGASALDLQVSVDGAAGQDIPDPSGINVIAVPTDVKTVTLVTAANGAKQSLSLLDGKPGPTNLTVLSRANRIGTFTPPKSFNFTESGGGATANRPCTLSGDTAGLFYWVDDTGSAHAAAPGNALIETNLKYTFTTDSPPPFTGSSAGDSATFESSHLTLTLPTGQKIAAKVLADHTVFEVPAGFTEGTVTIGGKYTNSNAITFTVAAPVSFKISIPTS